MCALRSRPRLPARASAASRPLGAQPGVLPKSKTTDDSKEGIKYSI